MEKILKIINDISDHYKSGKIYDKQNLVKLFLDHSSFEKFMVFFISSHEKEVEVTDDYINDILKDYDIEKSEVEKIFNDIKKPKEPSFSKNKLIKKPSFTKVKDSQIENTPNETRPSFNKSEGITLESETNDKSDSGINIISFLIPIIGIFIYATQKHQYPIKAKAALDSAISGIVIGVILGFISYTILLNQISSYNY